jgi:hypothetical protein
MKKYLSFIIISILVLSLAGCKTASKQEINNLVEDYKKAQYTVDDYKKLDMSAQAIDPMTEKCRPYLTETGWNSYQSLRYSSATAQAAIQQKCDIHLDKLDLKLYVDESKDGTMVYDYTAYLKLTSPDTNKEKIITHSGQVMLKKQDNAWKIESDLPGRLELPKDFTF